LFRGFSTPTKAHKYAKMWFFYSTVLWVPLYLNKIIKYSYLSDVDSKDGTKTSLMYLKPVISAGCADTSSPGPEIQNSILTFV